MGDEGETAAVWGSVEGIVLKGSLLDGEGGLTAIIRGQDGVEVPVTSPRAEISARIESAAASGELIILQGHLIRREGAPARLEVRIEGAVELVGTVSEIDRAPSADAPELRFWMIRELTGSDGATYRIGTGVSLSGPAVTAGATVRPGDRVALMARYGRDGFIGTSPMRPLPATDPEGADWPEP